MLRTLLSATFFWVGGSLFTLSLMPEKSLAEWRLSVFFMGIAVFLIGVKLYQRLFNQTADEGRLINLYKNFINKTTNRLRAIYLKHKPQPDSEPIHQLMTVFRRNYNDYFKEAAHQDSRLRRFNKQNGVLHIVQSNVTQTLWDRLYLQKRRLKRLKISIDYQVKRSGGGFIDFFAKGSRNNTKPTAKTTAKRTKSSQSKKAEPLFEKLQAHVAQSIILKSFGKAQFVVYEIFESIQSKTCYYRQGKKIKTLKNNHYAYYEIFNAEEADDATINCPSCGAKSSIVGLYDGCDFCQAQFEVECTGLKVANFSIKKDIRARFAKIERIVNRMIYSIYLLILWVFFSAILFVAAIEGVPSHKPSEGDGVLIFILGVGIVVPVAYLVIKIGYWVTDKVIRLFSLILYFFINHYKRKINERAYNPDFLRQIRGVDANFVYNAFYASVLEKIMILYFAENTTEIEGISTANFEHNQQNVIDLMFDDIYITDFYHNDRQMHITVQLTYQTLTLAGDKIRQSPQSHRLGLVKNISRQPTSKIQHLQCRHCGGNLAIISGRFCPFCRGEIDFMDYDWVIDEGPHD